MTQPATSLLSRVLRRSRGKELTKYLRGYAAEVVITARVTSPAAAGRNLGMELIGEHLSPTPILNIVAMVESGEIPMTSERLKEVVDQDEGAIRYFFDNPWIIDPAGKGASPVKKGRKPGKPPKPESSDEPEAPVTAQKIKEPRAKAAPIPLPEPKEKVGNEKTRDAVLRLTAEKLKELSQQESEHQREAFQQKKPEPTPPVFRGTPPPSINASEEERAEWRKISKKEKKEFILTAPSVGWEISEEWDGLQPIAKYAKWIGPLPA